MTHLVLNEELARAALKDKVVVLTGGSTGIGRAAVGMFAGMCFFLPLFSFVGGEGCAGG